MSGASGSSISSGIWFELTAHAERYAGSRSSGGDCNGWAKVAAEQATDVHNGLHCCDELPGRTHTVRTVYNQVAYD